MADPVDPAATSARNAALLSGHDGLAYNSDSSTSIYPTPPRTSPTAAIGPKTQSSEDYSECHLLETDTRVGIEYGAGRTAQMGHVIQPRQAPLPTDSKPAQKRRKRVHGITFEGSESSFGPDENTSPTWR